MSDSTFAQALVKKGERALATAKVTLRDGDMDGAYAMFNVARAALLISGVPESELPKSHNGLIGAFGEERLRSANWTLISDVRSARRSPCG